MFKRISYTIATQFTLFVFLLFLVNGIIFLFVDLSNEDRQSHFRLERGLELVTRARDEGMPGQQLQLPPQLRDRVRITDTHGKAFYEGNLFTDIPFSASDEFSGQ